MQFDVPAFDRDVTNLSWGFIIRTRLVHADCEKFTSLLMACHAKNTHIIKKEIHFKVIWMTMGLHRSSLRKHELYKQLQKRDITLSFYKAYRNKVSKCLRSQKKTILS